MIVVQASPVWQRNSVRNAVPKFWKLACGLNSAAPSMLTMAKSYTETIENIKRNRMKRMPREPIVGATLHTVSKIILSFSILLRSLKRRQILSTLSMMPMP